MTLNTIPGLCPHQCTPGAPDPGCPVHACTCRPLGGQHGAGCALKSPIVAPAVSMYDEAQARRAEKVEVLLADHRRLRNVRSCSGCGWTPSHVLAGRALADPEATRARHAEFNAHLAALIVETLP